MSEKPLISNKKQISEVQKAITYLSFFLDNPDSILDENTNLKLPSKPENYPDISGNPYLIGKIEKHIGYLSLQLLKQNKGINWDNLPYFKDILDIPNKVLEGYLNKKSILREISPELAKLS